jgi:hypothetical protein
MTLLPGCQHAFPPLCHGGVSRAPGAKKRAGSFCVVLLNDMQLSSRSAGARPLHGGHAAAEAIVQAADQAAGAVSENTVNAADGAAGECQSTAHATTKAAFS